MPIPMVRFFLSHTMQCTVGKLLKVSMSLICGAWQKREASGMMPSIHPQYLELCIYYITYITYKTCKYIYIYIHVLDIYTCHVQHISCVILMLPEFLSIPAPCVPGAFRGRCICGPRFCLWKARNLAARCEVPMWSLENRWRFFQTRHDTPRASQSPQCWSPRQLTCGAPK